jgi:hypothetical protein
MWIGVDFLNRVISFQIVSKVAKISPIHTHLHQFLFSSSVCE